MPLSRQLVFERESRTNGGMGMRQNAKAPQLRGFRLSARQKKGQDTQIRFFLRAAHPSATKPMPKSAKVPGSGTLVTILNPVAPAPVWVMVAT